MTTTSMYNYVLRNATKIGNKVYAEVPIALCKTDNRYQRAEFTTDSAIGKLVRLWDDRLMDPIKVVPHNDEEKFYVVDGNHRCEAEIIRGNAYILAEILTDMPNKANEVLKAEASIFCAQNNAIDQLTPQDKHNAKCVMGIPENLIIDRVAKKYGVGILKAKNRYKKANTISAYTEVERTARTHGEQLLDDYFYIITQAQWNDSIDGFSQRSVRGICNVLAYHSDDIAQVKRALIPLMKKHTCKELIEKAKEKYSDRYEATQITLYLEDYLHDVCGLPIIYANTDEAKKVKRQRKGA